MAVPKSNLLFPLVIHFTKQQQQSKTIPMLYNCPSWLLVCRGYTPISRPAGSILPLCVSLYSLRWTRQSTTHHVNFISAPLNISLIFFALLQFPLHCYAKIPRSNKWIRQGFCSLVTYPGTMPCKDVRLISLCATSLAHPAEESFQQDPWDKWTAVWSPQLLPKAKAEKEGVQPCWTAVNRNAIASSRGKRRAR